MSDRFKFKFLLLQDGKKSLSQEYSIDDLLEVSGEEGVFDMENECDCPLNESMPNCEGGCCPDYEKEEIIGTVQSTGSKDKNGKPIFEGNIVKGNHGETGVVAWSERGTRFGIQGSKPHYISRKPVSKFWTLIGCEIIGDIQQNPELLKS